MRVSRAKRRHAAASAAAILSCELRALILGALLIAGCSSVTGYPGIVLGNIKFPARVKWSEVKPVNKPLSAKDVEHLRTLVPDELPAQAEGRPVGFFDRLRVTDEAVERVDLFQEFEPGGTHPPVAVIIAVSGGGARAGMLAVATMALIEKRYNQLAKGSASAPRPLFDLVDGFSTVSGGSLYAYEVARRVSDAVSAQAAAGARGESVSEPPNERCPPLPNTADSTFFCQTAADPVTTRGVNQLGWYATQSVIGAYGLGLVSTLFTDMSYLDHLSKGLEYSRSSFEFLIPLPTPRFRFENLPIRPRFYFNTTSLETGGPFVLTQSIVHLPPPTLPAQTVRLAPPNDSANESCSECSPRRPLRSSLTLEEINSSPAKFPIAYAAATSAAFPIGVEPLPLRKYEYLAAERRVIRSKAVLSLADGGVYDNSGMITAVDVFEYLQKYRNVKHFVLIAINADASMYDSQFASEAFGPDDGIPFEFGWPIPSLFSAAKSLDLIHFVNKRRGENLAKARLMAMEASLRAESESEVGGRETRQQQVLAELQRGEPYQFVQYFPISLSQLSAADRYRIIGGESHYDAVKQVPTGYWTNRGDPEMLEMAAEKIISAPQQTGWHVGPNCYSEVKRLDDAVAFVMLRAGQRTWDDDPQGVGVDDWCAREISASAGG